MYRPMLRQVLGCTVVLTLVAAACAPAAPPVPTAAPAKPAPTAAPAKPTEAPAAKPTEKPAAKAEAKPAASPAAKPAEAKPAASPAAKPAAKFDAKAVESFYQGKNVRILVGFGAGGPFDIFARLLARHMPRYIPGSPTIVVEPRPGAASVLAANAVYNTEAKDGTVIGSIGTALALQQLLGAEGIQYDAARFSWLGNGNKTFNTCLVSKNSQVKRFQDVYGANAKELPTATIGPGTGTHNSPATLNAVFGARFKLISGYSGTPPILQAIQTGEVEGYCTSYANIAATMRETVEGPNAYLKVFVVMGDQVPNRPWLEEAVAVNPLAPNEEGLQMLRAVQSPEQLNYSYVMAPEVPRDRVEAMRKAMADTFVDREFLAEAERAGFEVIPGTGDEAEQIARRMLATPPAVVAKLKEAVR